MTHTTPPDLDADKLHRTAHAQGILPMWSVYRHAADYPQGYVARLHVLHPDGKSGPTSNAIFADTLDQVRQALPPGLWRMRRMADDVPYLVETWL